MIEIICFSGTPEGTRTPDLLVRSQSLYPTELPARTALSQRHTIIAQSGTKCKPFFIFFSQLVQLQIAAGFQLRPRAENADDAGIQRAAD